jgi:hypothetical protein
MRKINQQVLAAMQQKLERKLAANTYTQNELFNFDGVTEFCTVLYLHGSKIAATPSGSNKLYISNAGYETNVTKSRLNTLGAGIYVKAGIWYWKDHETFPNNTWIATQLSLNTL